MQAKNEMGAIKNHENRIDTLETINISSTEQATPLQRNGKRVYVKEIVYEIGTLTSYNADINIENASDVWIDVGNSYIEHSGIRLIVSQYHSSTDWNRAYLKDKNKIYFDFSTIYSNLSKTAKIVFLYTKE